MTDLEQRPFAKGERVYLLYGEGTQEPGTACDQARIFEDDGRDDCVLLADGRLIRAERVRRDRRGRKPPVYEEVPRG